MAKYNLSANTVVNCDILNESEGMYVVRFENGAINSVDKDRVHSLNDIDEGVLDMAKKAGEEISKFGRKVVRKAKDVAKAVNEFFVNAFKIGGFVFFKGDDGEAINASHPVNAMVAAESDKGINVYLSGSDIEMCREMGMEPRSIENYQYEGEYCGALQPEDLVNESYSKKGSNSVLEHLYEKQGDFIKGEPIDLRSPDLMAPSGKKEKLLEDFTQDEIVYTLMEEYEARLNDEEWTSLPTIIWGAPGIGKTQIIKNLVEILHKKHGGMEKPGIIVINARTVGPDSFSFPALVEKEESNIQRALRKAAWKKEHGAEEYDFSKDAASGRPSVPTGGIATIEDLPKSWMPVYNPDDPRGEEFIEIARKIANGGYVDKNDDVHDGPGGVLFIDEYSRMSPDGTTTLMNLPESRHFGDNSKTLGDRWIVVAAANRRGDLGKRARLDLDQNPTDAAINTRWSPVNFVPSFEDWEKWATKKKTENQQNVHPDILAYVKSTVEGVSPNEEGYGDYYNMSNLNGPVSDMGTAEPKACPRTWESFSGRYYKYLAEVAQSPDRYKFLFNLLQKTANKEVGAPVGRRFIEFITKVVFSDIDAKNVWKSGKATASTEKELREFFTGGGDFKTTMFNMILPKLESNYPNPGNENGISEDNLMNVIDWIESVCPAVKGGNGTKSSADLTDVFKQIEDMTNVPLIYVERDGSENVYAAVVNKVGKILGSNNLAIE